MSDKNFRDGMHFGHHTPEETVKAFGHAPYVLHELRVAGVVAPCFKLYADGSGQLILSEGEQGQKITTEQYERAKHLIFSNRPVFSNENVIGIQFCCGLVTGAKAREQKEKNDDRVDPS